MGNEVLPVHDKVLESVEKVPEQVKVLESVEGMGNIDFLGYVEKKDENAEKGKKNKEYNIDYKYRWEHVVENYGNLKFNEKGELKEGQSFKFDFQGNETLYKMTTAGQIMPPEVGVVTAGGQEWTRTNLLGEFFNKNNERLIIGDSEFKGNKGVLITETRDVESMQSSINLNINNLLKDNPEYDKDIVKAYTDRGLDINNFTMDKVKDLLKGLSGAKKIAKIEYILTGFERIRGKFNISENKLGDFMKNYFVENSIENIISKEKVIELVKKYFPAGVDIEKALKIVGKESSFNANSKRSFYDNPGGGNDLGLFQINDYYQRENIAKLGYTSTDMFDINKNIEVASLAYKEAGNSWHPWIAARELGLG